MRAQDDSAEEPLRAERRQVKPAEDCFPGDCLTTRALKDDTAPGNGRCDERLLREFIPALLRDLSAWPT